MSLQDRTVSLLLSIIDKQDAEITSYKQLASDQAEEIARLNKFMTLGCRTGAHDQIHVSKWPMADRVELLEKNEGRNAEINNVFREETNDRLTELEKIGE